MKYRTKVKCGKCGKVIPLKDGGILRNGKKFNCLHCGHINRAERKKNGKITIS